MSRYNRFVRETDDAEVIEEALNRTVAQHPADSAGASEETPLVPLTKPLGLRSGFDPAHLRALSDDLEADAFLELSRRLIDRSACR